MQRFFLMPMKKPAAFPRRALVCRTGFEPAFALFAQCLAIEENPLPYTFQSAGTSPASAMPFCLMNLSLATGIPSLRFVCSTIGRYHHDTTDAATRQVFVSICSEFGRLRALRGEIRANCARILWETAV